MNETQCRQVIRLEITDCFATCPSRKRSANRPIDVFADEPHRSVTKQAVGAAHMDAAPLRTNPVAAGARLVGIIVDRHLHADHRIRTHPQAVTHTNSGSGLASPVVVFNDSHRCRGSIGNLIDPNTPLKPDNSVASTERLGAERLASTAVNPDRTVPVTVE